MKVGGTDLVAGNQPYIVAEVGSNWKTFEDCETSIVKAAEAGANAAKFQLFTHQSLYGFPKTKVSAYREEAELQLDFIPRLKQKADQCRIDLMVTCFDPNFVSSVNPHVYAHKVASSDLNHEELLQELNRAGKPVFLSTGAAMPNEIKMALSILANVPVVVMYCVASYPARSIDLTVIDQLKQFSTHVGFSDHTLDAVYLPYAAYKFHGACVIEKHFNAIRQQTPDSPHSLSPADFALMVDKIRGKRVAKIGPTSEEQDMILRHKRRLIATDDLKKGDIYRKNKNYGVFRSLVLDTKGLSPWMANEINGKAAERDISKGEAIGAMDFA